MSSTSCKENPWEPIAPLNPKVWKTIKVGTGLKTPEDFQGAFKTNGFRLDGWAKGVLGRSKFVTATEEQEVDLALVSVEELGFEGPDDNGIEYQDICARILQRGLELCEPEDGPQLRLQYPDQPKWETLIMAMKSISDSDGYLELFDVTHDVGGRWLYCSVCRSAEARFYRRHRFVVRVPRKK